MHAFLVGPRNESPQRLRMLLKQARFDPNELLIGVDGGVDDWLALGYPPTMAIGDWDSIRSQERLKGIAQVTLPRKKDRSDFHFALKLAVSMGADRLTAFGVTGGRMDHHLASLFELSQAAKMRGVEWVEAWDESARYIFIAPRMGEAAVRLGRGTLFSLFSPLGAARGVSVRGAEYPLEKAQLAPGSLGLSNHARTRDIVVSVKTGVVLVVIPTSGM